MTLSHDVAGDGPALLLLHSAVGDRRMWDPQWQSLLDAGYRVIRCDLRGFGESPMPTAPYHNVTDVIELLDVLGVDSTVVVGASFGGEVALTLAAAHPKRVAALALLCAAPIDQDPSDRLRAFATKEDELIEAGRVAEAVELNLDTWLGPDTDDATRVRMRQMQRHAFDVQMAVTEEFGQVPMDVNLAHVTAPVLAVSGDHDLPDFGTFAASLPAKIPGATHVALDWAGHLPSVERPAETTELLLDFLTRHHRA